MHPGGFPDPRPSTPAAAALRRAGFLAGRAGGRVDAQAQRVPGGSEPRVTRTCDGAPVSPRTAG
ncbi:hypothetical protein TOK_6241 [Pseudonocardia sp. N23]|nr:hypothetical protein TOK_6241 [Pseudonocardia sp. N23]